MKPVGVMCTTFILSLLPALAAGSPPFDARLEEDDRIAVCGAAGGDGVLLWGVGYRVGDLFPGRVRVAALVKEADRDGCYRHQPGLVPPYTLLALQPGRSELIALTDRDGGHRLGDHPARPPFAAAFTEKGLTLRGPASAEVLLHRTGQGLWLAVAADGGPGDADGTGDGVLTLAAHAFRPVAGTRGELRDFAAGDTAAAIDLDTLTLAVAVRPGL